MEPTATLQQETTTAMVKRCAKEAQVSERMIWDVLKLYRSGRFDLVAKIRSGEIKSISTALRLAGLRGPRGSATVADHCPHCGGSLK